MFLLDKQAAREATKQWRSSSFVKSNKNTQHIMRSIDSFGPFKESAQRRICLVSIFYIFYSWRIRSSKPLFLTMMSKQSKAFFIDTVSLPLFLLLDPKNLIIFPQCPNDAILIIITLEEWARRSPLPAAFVNYLFPLQFLIVFLQAHSTPTSHSFMHFKL